MISKRNPKNYHRSGWDLLESIETHVFLNRENRHGEGIPPPTHGYLIYYKLTQMGVIHYQMRCL